MTPIFDSLDKTEKEIADKLIQNVITSIVDADIVGQPTNKEYFLFKEAISRYIKACKNKPVTEYISIMGAKWSPWYNWDTNDYDPVDCGYISRNALVQVEYGDGTLSDTFNPGNWDWSYDEPSEKIVKYRELGSVTGNLMV